MRTTHQHRPAHDATGAQARYRDHIKPTLCRPDAGKLTLSEQAAANRVEMPRLIRAYNISDIKTVRLQSLRDGRPASAKPTKVTRAESDDEFLISSIARLRPT